MLRDWTDSEAIDSLTADEERFFTRLIMKADDFGVYPANGKFLKSTLFPLKEITQADADGWLVACEAAGLVETYEVSGKKYLKVRNFAQRMRKHVSKYPGPDGNPLTIDGQLTDNGRPDLYLEEKISLSREEEKAPQKTVSDRIVDIGPTDEPFIVIRSKYLTEPHTRIHGPAALAEYVNERSGFTPQDRTLQRAFESQGKHFNDYQHLFNHLAKLAKQ
jgi:uncharacterized protein YvpB